MALLFGLVNALIGTLLRLISLPLTLMTFGLFGLVINGVLLAITAGLTDCSTSAASSRPSSPRWSSPS